MLSNIPDLKKIYKEYKNRELHNESDLKDPSGISQITKSSLKYKLLTTHKSFLENKSIHILRRRNKVEQFRSWLFFRAMKKHNGMIYNNPLDKMTIDDKILNLFLSEQIIDYSFTPDKIVYYEDIIKEHTSKRFKKNIYNVDMKDFITNWEEVEYKLGLFEYNE